LRLSRRQARPRRDATHGRGWCHEVKWDGFRVQLYKFGDGVPPKDLTSRLRDIVQAVAALPCKICIIDAKGCAIDAGGQPGFRALIGGQKQKTRVCFDLLEIDARHAAFPVTRRVRLNALLSAPAATCCNTKTPFRTRPPCSMPATRAAWKGSFQSGLISLT
jgi:ATP-dependent DNA ligase